MCVEPLPPGLFAILTIRTAPYAVPKMAKIKGESKPTSSIEASSVPVRINRQLEGDTDNEIETRPTFINRVMLARTGSDVFMDIGIMPADDLLNSEEKHEIRFIVLDRLVMGLETFMQVHDVVVRFYDQLKEAGMLPNEKIITP
jgi:hypothetical protein